jgi:hypothetical protein
MIKINSAPVSRRTWLDPVGDAATVRAEALRLNPTCPYDGDDHGNPAELRYLTETASGADRLAPLSGSPPTHAPRFAIRGHATEVREGLRLGDPWAANHLRSAPQ